MKKNGLKGAAGLLIAGFLLCMMTSCSENMDTVQVLDKSETEPEYLSFFSVDDLYGGNSGKYWSDCFTDKYNREVYINSDGAGYYSDQGLSYRELLEKRLQSSQPDDLYIINAEDVLDFEKKGYWMDLSDMDFVDNLSEASLYQSTYNGKVFSVPLSFTGFGFLWNVDMLKTYKLDIPENIDEFLNVCEVLKSEGIVPYGANKGYALTVPAMCKGLAKLYGSDDCEQLIESLNSADTAISSYMLEGFEFIAMMIEKGYMDPEQALNTIPIEDMELLYEGKCAFICVGISDATKSSIERKEIKLEFTGIPVLADDCIAVYGANSRLCVNPNSKHLDMALKFVEMVGTVEALAKSSELNYTLTSAKDGGEVEYPIQQNMNELLKKPGQIPNQDFALHFNTWENIRNVCREICSGLSVDEACNKLDELQLSELKEYSVAK